MKPQCVNCLYGETAGPSSMECRRFPTFVFKKPEDWCGEWFERPAKEPTIDELKARLESVVNKVHGFLHDNIMATRIPISTMGKWHGLVLHADRIHREGQSADQLNQAIRIMESVNKEIEAL
jgi:hypothetical protein